jgi:uncharacterized protein YyaL (SSP411 family)
MNRLAHESSPYLLQHAHNPVDWYPWGDEALARARAEDKPLLVSIGYSACHWCHVMERESFENDDVAVVMNRHFVCVKIDREERPDVDAIYMDAVQAMGVRGGWPLHVFLMPDARPFYGGTYFPPQRWTRLLHDIAAAFVEHRAALQESADGFAQHLGTAEREKYALGVPDAAPAVEPAQIAEWLTQLSERFDPERGGLAGAPKFPMPAVWRFVLRAALLTGHVPARAALHQTLAAMTSGGLYDVLGGGFARYSTDADWFVPHFEKMGYDNGQLLSLYAEAARLPDTTDAQRTAYHRVLRETIGWLRRELLAPEGGFYAALDADSEGEEGLFYTWTSAELKELLGTDYESFASYYQITEAGNYHDEATHHPTGRNILRPRPEVPEPPGLDALRQRLLQTREGRVRPGLDDKILTSWNGLLLRGLVDAYRALGDEPVLKLAQANADFVRQYLTDGPQLRHSYKDGRAKISGFLDDYAAMIDGFTALYQVTFEEAYLRDAERWTAYVLEQFWDEADGLFFYTDATAEALIARKKELFDNVIPSSNAMMGHNLLTLGHLLGRPDWRDRAVALLARVRPLLSQHPDYLSHWASLATALALPMAEVVIVGPEAHRLRREFDERFEPSVVVAGTRREGTLPLLEGRSAAGTETLIYVCFNQTCQLPVRQVDEARRQLHHA